MAPSTMMLLRLGLLSLISLWRGERGQQKPNKLSIMKSLFSLWSIDNCCPFPQLVPHTLHSILLSFVGRRKGVSE